jgi:purine-binding chemotaxis protein CheW
VVLDHHEEDTVDLKYLRDDPAAWRILEERARALMVQESDVETEVGEEILAFRLGEGDYSVPAQYVCEVQLLGEITPLPFTPAFLIGLVNIRGRLLAALDIRPLLDMPEAPPQPQAFLLVLAANGLEVGLLADAVVEVRRGDEQLAPVLSSAAGRGIAWVRGVDRRLSMLLDPPALLADPRLAINGAP